MSSATSNRLTDAGLLLIRVALAAVFMYHGSQKLFGWFDGPGLQGTAGFMASLKLLYPMAIAVLAGSAEFFGGLVLLLGTGARVAAIPMAFTMAVAIATVHRGGFNAQTGGMEYPLTLGLILIALVLTGPGRFTVGRLVAKDESRERG